jgi:hypothetical protein
MSRTVRPNPLDPLDPSHPTYRMNRANTCMVPFPERPSMSTSDTASYDKLIRSFRTTYTGNSEIVKRYRELAWNIVEYVPKGTNILTIFGMIQFPDDPRFKCEQFTNPVINNNVDSIFKWYIYSLKIHSINDACYCFDKVY